MVEPPHRPRSTRTTEGPALSTAPGRATSVDVREMIGELFEYRELLRSIVVRDLTVRYKQTVLGFAWAVLVPMASTLVFTVVFTRIAPLETDVPYPLYAYAGLLPWTFFTNSLTSVTGSLTANAGLVTKVYFPREVFPLSSIAVGLTDFLIASSVLFALMLYYGVAIGWTILWVPAVVAVQVAFTLGLGLVLAVGNLFYRDVRYLVSVVLGIWMFATSVVYPLEGLEGPLAGALRLNPMTPVIDAYRAVILRGETPWSPAFLVVAAGSVLLLAAGWLFFHRAEPRFAENA